MTDDATTTTTDAPEAEPAPTDELREGILAGFRERLGDAVVDAEVQPGLDLWIRVRTDAWREAAEVARHHLDARYFTFISVLDWLPSPFGRSMDAAVDLELARRAGEEAATPSTELAHGITGGETRFQVFARVAKVGHPNDFWGVTLKADVPDDTLTVDSWVPVYAGADWHEREAWEMFGLTFTGHPGLRNIYLPSDFEGHPLRKDFPLLARQVKPWPGIVDVEPMPGSGDEEEGEADA
ncbi:MAG: NADH-quinone oxidoreductase subunit C [Microthrixaceae bacterium]